MKKLVFVAFCVLGLSNARAENGRPLKNRFHQPVPQPSLFDSVAPLKPVFSFSNTLATSYLWRGMVFNEGLMFQPAVDVTYGKWTLGTWSNVVAVETNGNRFVPEMQFSLCYEHDGENYGVTPQANFYFYPQNWEHISTLELGFDAFYELDNLGFCISPNLDVADNYGGLYVDYGIYKTGWWNERLSYKASMLLGWGNKRFCDYYNEAEPVLIETNANPKRLPEHESLKSMQVQLSADYCVSDRFSVQPQLVMFRNFMMGYAFDSRVLRTNAAVTCAYSF